MTASAETVFAVQQALQRPIAFHRVFAQIGGGIVPGLFLSQLWYWHGRGADPEWIHKTIVEWTEETGLSRKEQDRAKRELVSRGLISIEKRGVPCRCYFRLNMAEIIEKIASNPDGCPVCPDGANKNVPTVQASLSRSDKPVCPDRTNKNVPIGQTLYKETEITNRDYTETTHRSGRENFSNDQDSETIVDRLIQALEIGNASIVKAEMRSQGFFLPWRLNGKNSNSATNFDRRLLDRVLRHLRATASGNEAMLGDAARWVSLREDTPKGLREINTFWEEAQAIQEPTATPIAHVSTPQSENPLEAARSLYNAIKFAKRSNARNAITARLRAQIEAVRNSGLEVDPEWLEITGESDAA